MAEIHWLDFPETTGDCWFAIVEALREIAEQLAQLNETINNKP